MGKPFIQRRPKTPRHLQWDKLKKARSKVRMDEVQFSGFLGFSAILDDPTTNLDRLVPSDQIRFACVRYTKVGAFPNLGKPKEGHLASYGRARLAYNMPLIDLTDARNLVNFRDRPDSELRGHPVSQYDNLLNHELYDREFGVYNAMVADVDRRAFCGVDSKGKPIRPSWFYRRPKNLKDKIKIEHRPEVNIEAFVGVDRDDLDLLYNMATEKSVDRQLRYACPKCNAKHRAEEFTRRKFKTQWFEDGNFVATCSKCRTRRKYFVDNALPEREHRSFNMAFKIGFCEWVAAGGPFVMRHYAKYVESCDVPGECYGPDLTMHGFTDGDLEYDIFMPPKIAPHFEPGMLMRPGDVFANVVTLSSEKLRAWAKQSLKDRWLSLPDVFGGKDMLGFVQKLWFDNQATPVDTGSGRHVYAFPTSLIGQAAGKIRTHGLWWDLSAAKKHLRPELGAIVFPSIRIKQWDQFQVDLPGQIRLDARVDDPRFDPECTMLDEIKKEQARRHRPKRDRNKPNTKDNEVVGLTDDGTHEVVELGGGYKKAD